MKDRILFAVALSATLAAPVAAQPSGFPTLNAIVQEMQDAANAFPNIAQFVDVTAKYGTPPTWQGRNIYALKISDNVAQEEDEPAFLMVSSHHSNEYGTPIVALDAIARFTQGYGSDPEITRLVDSYEIWIAPVWNPDGYWTRRHNRRAGGGVDLNRNYPFLWSSPCNTGVKGPSAGSEPETQAMVALSEDQRFAKVLDYHSSGRETLYGYRSGCPNHVFLSYYRSEAGAISTASGYGGRTRGPSSNGEHYQWQMGVYSNYAFLTEISNTQSPSITSANNEADRVWPGTLFMLNRPIPVAGHVTDATSGDPVPANLSYVENPFTEGEINRAEPRFGRYHAFLPNGSHTLRFEHPCYVTQNVAVNVTAAGVTMDVQLQRAPGFTPGTSVARNGSGLNPMCLSAAGVPTLGSPWDITIDASVFPSASFVGFLSFEGAGAGSIVPFGEILVNPASPLVFIVSQRTTGGPSTYTVNIPADPSGLGFAASIQGIVANGDRIQGLCNAIDYVIGC
ncbi:MAG: M14 family zinc carboxypeptidase [Planctomycetota bacterium]